MVAAALDTGYRHIDTAAAYGNEREVGEAVHADRVRQELGNAGALINNTTEVFLDQLKDRGGDIINISSVAGRTARSGQPANSDAPQLLTNREPWRLSPLPSSA